MSIPILYADSFLAVCEKPVGIPSESPGLPDLLSAQTGKKVWPVHRLDQGTGGAMIFAFSSESCSVLQKMFQQSLIRKEYYAVISGCPETDTGRWQDLLWHDKARNKSYIVSRSRKGVKEAGCEWTVLGTSEQKDQRLSLVRVLLETGRTHQVRVQFGSRGFPLAGDRKYGSRISCSTYALWSARISFPHPDRKRGFISVSSQPPSVFPWNLFSFPGS